MKAILFSAVTILSVANLATAGSITGTVLNLDGRPLDRVQQFSVVAEVAGGRLATGRLLNNEAPFIYQIDIPNEALNPKDVRVTLRFNALGRDEVLLNNIAGNVNHTISVVMPIKSTKCPPPTCHQRSPKKCRLLRHKCR